VAYGSLAEVAGDAHLPLVAQPSSLVILPHSPPPPPPTTSPASSAVPPRITTPSWVAAMPAEAREALDAWTSTSPLVQRRSILAVVNLFLVAFIVTASARGQYKSSFLQAGN
jgi:hypothetical protein